MSKNILFFALLFSVSVNSQTQKSPKNSNILKDGMYQANISCINYNVLDTNNTRRFVWIEVENDIVIYIGKSIAKSPRNNFLIVNQNRIISVPFLKKKRKKIIAEYSLSSQVQSNNTNSGRNIDCKIEVIRN